MSTGSVDVVQRFTFFRAKQGANRQTLRDEYGQPYWEPYTVTQSKKVATDAENNVVTYSNSASSEETSSNYQSSNRGYPSPAQGLGTSTLGGSDVLEEDVEISSLDLPNQLRVSLPSLERRIGYRSAALALWAAVAYDGIDITRVDDPNLIYAEPDDGSPTPSVPPGRSLLRRSQNPLLPEFQMPTTSDKHRAAAMVLSLSYVAHAAVMVTGYRPPFYRNYNTSSGHDDALLVADGEHPLFRCAYDELPFRANEATFLVQDAEAKIYLPGSAERGVAPHVDGSGTLDLTAFGDPALYEFLKAPAGSPTAIAGKFLAPDGTIVADPSRLPVILRYSWLRNPYHPDLIKFDANNKPTTPPLTSDTLLTSADPTLYQRTPDGRPITYRRMVGGIISPFPPPYADAGCMDLAGQRRYQVRWQLDVVWLKTDGSLASTPGEIAKPQYRLLRRVLPPTTPGKTWKGPGSLDPVPGSDSAYARAAHDHCLRAAMDYTSRNPYDLLVPKPMNRQTFIDQGLYQFDLFDNAGNARRPQQLTSDKAKFDSAYTITCPVGGTRGDLLRPGVAYAATQMVDSVLDYTTYHKFSRTFPPRADGSPFLFGSVIEGNAGAAAGNQVADPYTFPRDYTTWVNAAHGWGLSPTSQSAPARPARFTGTRAFTPSERTRQLVYWLVDWQQYEDAESAPSAPVDLSQTRREQNIPFVSGEILSYNNRNSRQLVIRFWKDSSSGHYGYAPGSQVQVRHDRLGSTDIPLNLTGFAWQENDWVFTEPTPGAYAAWGSLVGTNAYFYKRLGTSSNTNEWSWLTRNSGDNPEANFTWMDPERTSTRIVWDRAVAHRYDHAQHNSGYTPAYGFYASKHAALPLTPLEVSYMRTTPQSQYVVTSSGLQQNPLVALGAFGADRNGNGVFDRGPVPTSTRMQASEIARFNFYDPIAWVVLGR